MTRIFHSLVAACCAAFLTVAMPVAAKMPASPDAALSSNPAADRLLTIDGNVVRIRDEGPRKAPPIILIHGFTFSLETWDTWAADLARDHRVIRYDLAGHGLSGPDRAGRYATLDREAQLGLIMDKLHIRKAVIAGNSLGALVAWNFAADHPERVAKLVLIDAGAFPFNGAGDKPVPVPPLMRGFLMAPSAAGVAFTATRIYAEPKMVPPATLDRLRLMIARNGPAMIAHLEQFTLPDPVAKLGRVKAPTLILWGGRDSFIPVGDADRIAAAIPGSTRVIVDGAGHLPQEEAPAETLAALRGFLAKR